MYIRSSLTVTYTYIMYMVHTQECYMMSTCISHSDPGKLLTQCYYMTWQTLTHKNMSKYNWPISSFVKHLCKREGYAHVYLKSWVLNIQVMSMMEMYDEKVAPMLRPASDYSHRQLCVL